MIERYLTILGMLATLAWFLWNPDGWTFQWEPIVVFIFSVTGFIASEVKYNKKTGQNSTVSRDSKLFSEYCELLPSSGVIDFLKHHDFILSFDSDRIDPLHQFLYSWDNAEYVFCDKKIEKKKLEFHEATKKFLANIGAFTYPNRNGRQSVFVEERNYTDEERITVHSYAKTINDSADKVYSIHQDVVKLGRSKL